MIRTGRYSTRVARARKRPWAEGATGAAARGRSNFTEPPDRMRPASGRGTPRHPRHRSFRGGNACEDIRSRYTGLPEETPNDRRLATTQSEERAMSAKSPPAGYHTVTPSIIVRDAAQAIEFYKRAFGAEEVTR